jgi:hypothetical protein
VELHGPCGVFFSDDSIKYQYICHCCHKNIQVVADTSLSANADHDMNVQSVADALLSPEDYSQVESALAAVAVALKVAERKSVVTILGYKAELFTADQIRQFCAHLKLPGYGADQRMRPLVQMRKRHSQPKQKAKFFVLLLHTSPMNCL